MVLMSIAQIPLIRLKFYVTKFFCEFLKDYMDLNGFGLIFQFQQTYRC